MFNKVVLEKKKEKVSCKCIHQEIKCMVNEGVENNIMHTSNHPNPLPLLEVKWCGPQRDRTQATLECLPFTQTPRWKS